MPEQINVEVAHKLSERERAAGDRRRWEEVKARTSQHAQEAAMADEAPRCPSSRRAGQDVSGWAVGFTLFAAVMMIISGIWQAIFGLIAMAPMCWSSISQAPAASALDCSRGD